MQLIIYYKNNFMQVDNYKQIYELTSDLIVIEGLSIKGTDLKVLYLDKDRIEIKGNILCAYKGDNYAIPCNDEKG